MTTGTQEHEAPEATPPAIEAPHEAHPLGERYLTPLLLPVLAVATLLFYVLNVSRVFLSAEGAGAVVAATVMTLAILGGATLISAAPRMRNSSLVLVVAAIFAVIAGSGMVTASNASPKAEGGAVSFTPVVGSSQIESGNIYFRPTKPAPVPVGVVKFEISNTGGDHTFEFDSPQVQVQNGKGVMSGAEKVDVLVRFPAAGEFTFFCAIPGHRAAGMQGTVTVDATLPTTPIEGGGESTTTAP